MWAFIKKKGYAQLEISTKERMQLLTQFATHHFLSGKRLRKDFQCCMQHFILFIQGQTRTFPPIRSFWSRFCTRPSWSFRHHCSTVSVDGPQAIDFFHWKMVFWGERMLLWMEDILDNIRELPHFKKHLAEVENF